ncbi:hypothetical protein GVAV_000951 [Gurleya vavrai]
MIITIDKPDQNKNDPLNQEKMKNAKIKITNLLEKHEYSESDSASYCEIDQPIEPILDIRESSNLNTDNYINIKNQSYLSNFNEQSSYLNASNADVTQTFLNFEVTCSYEKNPYIKTKSKNFFKNNKNNTTNNNKSPQFEILSIKKLEIIQNSLDENKHTVEVDYSNSIDEYIYNLINYIVEIKIQSKTDLFKRYENIIKSEMIIIISELKKNYIKSTKIDNETVEINVKNINFIKTPEKDINYMFIIDGKMVSCKDFVKIYSNFKEIKNISEKNTILGILSMALDDILSGFINIFSSKLGLNQTEKKSEIDTKFMNVLGIFINQPLLLLPNTSLKFVIDEINEKSLP